MICIMMKYHVKNHNMIVPCVQEHDILSELAEQAHQGWTLQAWNASRLSWLGLGWIFVRKNLKLRGLKVKLSQKKFWTKKEISPQPNSHEILLYRELLAGPMDYNHFNTEHGGWKLTSCTLTCWNMYPRARGQTGAREEVKGPGEETSLIIREDYSDHYHHKSAK